MQKPLDKGVFAVVYLSCNSTQTVAGRRLFNNYNLSDYLLFSESCKQLSTIHQPFFNKGVGVSVVGYFFEKIFGVLGSLGGFPLPKTPPLPTLILNFEFF